MNNSDFTEQKPFRPITKTNITSNKSCCLYVATDKYSEENFTSGIFFPQTHNPVYGEWIKAYENWTQARRDAVNCFYL
jgi:hypothetical protein